MTDVLPRIPLWHKLQFSKPDKASLHICLIFVFQYHGSQQLPLVAAALFFCGGKDLCGCRGASDRANPPENDINFTPWKQTG